MSCNSDSKRCKRVSSCLKRASNRLRPSVQRGSKHISEQLLCSSTHTTGTVVIFWWLLALSWVIKAHLCSLGLSNFFEVLPLCSHETTSFATTGIPFQLAYTEGLRPPRSGSESKRLLKVSSSGALQCNSEKRHISTANFDSKLRQQTTHQ